MKGLLSILSLLFLFVFAFSCAEPIQHVYYYRYLEPAHSESFVHFKACGKFLKQKDAEEYFVYLKNRAQETRTSINWINLDLDCKKESLEKVREELKGKTYLVCQFHTVERTELKNIIYELKAYCIKTGLANIIEKSKSFKSEVSISPPIVAMVYEEMLKEEICEFFGCITFQERVLISP
jgi:hypothetical protein